MKIKATLISDKITSNTLEAQNLFATSRFGEKIGEKIFYSLSEALYLIDDKKMEILNPQNKKLTQEEILRKFEKIDKKFKIKYLVFKDLRKKGYIVKSALKFGAEFRIYDKGKKVDKSHSKWICFPVSENKQINWQEFSAKNRIANSIKKNLLVAIVDEEGAISYYEVKWTRI
ncbi:tRNA-intron lyase [Candidatus Pacearchaeota archaeon]|nr:tRNA-intron lyase [Candidatus Pacearchaeota archaeon]